MSHKVDRVLTLLAADGDGKADESFGSYLGDIVAPGKHHIRFLICPQIGRHLKHWLAQLTLKASPIHTVALLVLIRLIESKKGSMAIPTNFNFLKNCPGYQPLRQYE